MRYSLLSRFRGCLLGAAVGEAFGGINKQHHLPTEWGRVMILGAESLIRHGGFNAEDWHQALLLFAESCQCLSSRDPLGVIVGTLPLFLFYHENEIKLRQNFLTLVDIWHDDLVSRDGALAVGYATLQSLTEKLNRATLIPLTINFLGAPSPLAQQLAQVQTLLEQDAGLERVVTHLSRDTQPSTPIALAFYCFLSTIEDLRLSISRAARTGYQSQLTSAITGALSGTYNSTVGIPATLRMALSRPDVRPLAAWGMKTEADVLELSDYLLAAWSGVYDNETHPNGFMPLAAIAAPGIIR